MTKELILLVDDEPNILQLAQLYVEREGFEVATVGDGLEALAAVQRHEPALIVLDIMLPGMDGFDVCRQLRADGNQVPILMLTARDEDFDKIVGLELGADDYLTKPFNPRELVARIKAILRRGDRAAQTDTSSPIRIADLQIEPARREVRIVDEQVDLRTQEFELLVCFARHVGMVLTREQLLQMAWGYDFYGQTRTVDVHVAHLRKKIANSVASIETITGVGYKFVLGD
jgi:DNA-binding response OmpR family regulator